MRKLATVRKIDALEPIDGADLIETATIGGWKVVVKKGEFSVGQLAVYFEIDSFIPTELAPFLTKEGKEPREYNDIKGERLRTVRLRGTCSQGLLLKLEDCFDIVEIEHEKYINMTKYNDNTESKDVHLQNNK
jgi:RNA ligase (TIGR02306 family)